jgi:hypothetical protein
MKRARKRDVVERHVEYCPRHSNAEAEVLCLECASLYCIHCAFECGQQQHKCVKVNDQALERAVALTGASIDAAFDLGSRQIDSLLDEDIHKLRSAAEQRRLKLSEFRIESKAKIEGMVKRDLAAAVAQKDVRRMCELLGESKQPSQPAFNVDVSRGIILRAQRKIQYENGTVYTGFVDVATGLPDGEGCVTWGAAAGRSSRKSYTGIFSAGLTEERLMFKWIEKRPGQACSGQHAYNGTVEVSDAIAVSRRVTDGLCR